MSRPFVHICSCLGRAVNLSTSQVTTDSMRKVSLVLFLVFTAAIVTGQRSRRGPKMCHLQQVDSCFAPMVVVKEEGSEIITTEPGLDRLCATVSKSVNCLRSYLRRCSTPLQRELFNFFTEQFSLRLGEFCNSTSLKKDLLSHSPCIHSNVFTSLEYKSTCVRDLLAALNSGRHLAKSRLPDAAALVSSLIEPNAIDKANTSDSLLQISCCGFNRFRSCFESRVNQHCGDNAVGAINFFTSRTLGIGVNRICPLQLFPQESTSCTSVLPVRGTDPDLSDLSKHALVKYMRNFGFMF